MSLEDYYLASGDYVEPAWCIECADNGITQPVKRRLGAWMCPIHRDIGHITGVNPSMNRNALKDSSTEGRRTAEQIAPPVPTPETDAAPPDGSGVKMIMLAGAIKAWWMYRCPVCGRMYERMGGCFHTGTKYATHYLDWDHGKRPAMPLVPMWDSPLHQRYLAYRRDLLAALVASQRYATYAPHNAIKGRWTDKFQTINDGAIMASDLMVVMSPKDIVTEGTDAEIIYAGDVGTPVLWVPMDKHTPETALADIDLYFEINS